MKITSKLLQIGAIVCALFLIVFFLGKMIFKFEVDPKLENDVSTYVFLIGIGLWMWSRSVRKKEYEASQSAEEEKKLD